MPPPTLEEVLALLNKPKTGSYYINDAGCRVYVSNLNNDAIGYYVGRAGKDTRRYINGTVVAYRV